MVKKARIQISCILLALFCICLITPINGAAAIDYTIDTPYEYPIRPGSEEWYNFETNDEMIAACQIPEEILYAMTTDALLQTILDYPMSIDFLGYETPQAGYEAVSHYFNAIDEFSSRPDAISVIQEYQNQETFSTLENNVISSDDVISSMVLQVIAYGVSGNTAPNITPRISYTVVRTPNLTEVPVKVGMLWEHHNIYDLDVVQAEMDQVASIYPKAEKLADQNPGYNCHSYAWALTTTNNNIWMEDPSAYIEDGSYTRVSSVRVGDRVLYGTAGNHPSHSAVVVSTDILVDSKWGYLGLYRHSPAYGMYKESFSFWRKA